jgi:FKBP-type peptidyl-prolyl cis-trans isomerase
MARKRERIFAMMGAVLFLATGSTVTIAVIYQMYQNHQASSKASSTSKTTATPAPTPKGGKKLQGTQLQGFTPVEHIDSLQKIDTTAGTGAVVKPSDTVTVDYTGAVAATGVIFQSSLDTGQTVSFGLNQVIKGWTDGVPGMQVGGTRRLLIPAADAYGANPPSGSGIPANADLVFDITLHKIGS